MNKVRNNKTIIDFKTKRYAHFVRTFLLRGLRDDFRTLDWVEAWEGLRYSVCSIDELLNRKQIIKNVIK